MLPGLNVYVIYKSSLFFGNGSLVLIIQCSKGSLPSSTSSSFIFKNKRITQTHGLTTKVNYWCKILYNPLCDLSDIFVICDWLLNRNFFFKKKGKSYITISRNLLQSGKKTKPRSKIWIIETGLIQLKTDNKVSKHSGKILWCYL